MVHWFMTAPLPVIVCTGIILAVPLWMLVIAALEKWALSCASPYAQAQRQYEEARDRYQASLKHER